MAVTDLAQTRADGYRRRMWLYAGGSVLVVLLLAAHVFLTRLRMGRLFLWSLPGERPASRQEIELAGRLATTYHLPALLTIIIGGAATIWLIRRHSLSVRIERLKAARWVRNPVIWLVLALAALLDGVTTCYFFWEHGIDLELHPAVQLMAFAYGRGVGPGLAKLIQLTGVLFLAFCFPRAGWLLALLASAIYAVAAAVNVWALLALRGSQL